MTEKAAYLAGRRNLRREVEVIGVGILLHEVVVGNVQIQRAAVGDEAVGLRGGAGKQRVSGERSSEFPKPGGDLNAGDAPRWLCTARVPASVRCAVIGG